jgi:hypothetical protein
MPFEWSLNLLATNKYATFMYLLGICMPQRVICHGCKHILYEGKDLKPPDEVIAQHGGKCPKCDRKLSLLPMEVEVNPIAKR